MSPDQHASSSCLLEVGYGNGLKPALPQSVNLHRVMDDLTQGVKIGGFAKLLFRDLNRADDAPTEPGILIDGNVQVFFSITLFAFAMTNSTC